MKKKWTSQEENEVIESLKSGVSPEEIAKRIGRTAKSVREKLYKKGFKYEDFKILKPAKICECCGEVILNYGIDYCSSSCSAKINNTIYQKRIPRIIVPCLNCGTPTKQSFCSADCSKVFKYNLNIENWKNGLSVGYNGKTIQLKPFIRKFLLEKYNNKCCKCRWCEINPTTNKIPLEVNHIDGDAKNCKEENLEVICPNCHSLTHNFRALNKNSSRNRGGIGQIWTDVALSHLDYKTSPIDRTMGLHLYAGLTILHPLSKLINRLLGLFYWSYVEVGGNRPRRPKSISSQLSTTISRHQSASCGTRFLSYNTFNLKDIYTTRSFNRLCVPYKVDSQQSNTY